MITQVGRLPDTDILPVSLVLSGLVFAGAGGVNNLAQSNWIRDKGFGMGAYIPRIVSPITGEEVAAPATGSMLRQDAENLRRFRGWWAVANKEQLVSFWFICIFSITRLLDAGLFHADGRKIPSGANLGFILAEGRGPEGGGRPLVRHVLLGVRRALADSGGARRPRLRLAHRRRRPEDGLPRGQPAMEREPHLLHRRLEHRRRRIDHPALGRRISRCCCW